MDVISNITYDREAIENQEKFHGTVHMSVFLEPIIVFDFHVRRRNIVDGHLHAIDT